MDQLSESEKLELGIGLSETPVILTNALGKISWINESANTLICSKHQNCIGTSLVDFLQNLNAKCTKNLDELLHGSKSVKFRLSFNEKHFAFSSTPVFKNDDRFAGFSIIGQDITDIHLSEVQLKQSHQEQSDFFNLHVSPMCFTDINGNFIMANQAYGDLFELNCDEIIGKNFIDIHCKHYSKEEQIALREETEKTLNTKNPKHVKELSFFTTSGKPLHIEVTRKINKIRNRMVVSVYINDLTEKNESKNKIQEQNSRLREFAFLTSHKLRQPLANVLGLIDLVKSESESKNDVTITLETLRMLTGQLDQVVHEMSEVLTEIDSEVEKSLFFSDNEEGRVEDVWLVDDDQVIAYITERMISNTDPSIKITSFLSAKMALEKLRLNDYKPDILLLDINMPGISGWDFLDELRNMHCFVNVYMYSSSIDPEDIKKARSYPMVKDFLSKPLDEAVVRRILEIPVLKNRVS